METPYSDINGMPARIPLRDREKKPENTLLCAHTTHSSEDTLSDVKAVGLQELFETDERPVLIYDLNSPTKTVPVYLNVRLRELGSAGLKLADMGCEMNADSFKDCGLSDFLQWAIACPVDGKIPAANFFGRKWTSQTLRNRWRVIAGRGGVDISISRYGERRKSGSSKAIISPAPPVSHATLPPTSDETQFAAYSLRRGHSSSVSHVSPGEKTRNSPVDALQSLGSYDILSENPLIEHSAHIEFFLNFDWASTDLGSIDSWSMELRRMVNLLLADPRPAALFWGENRIMLYNEPYALATGQKHPFMMGKPFVLAWSEVADDFAALFETGRETGKATLMEDALFYLERHGYLEETYYSISIIPFGTSDGCKAFYNAVFDTTRQVIAERRMTFLLRLGQHIATCREPRQFWQQLLLGLAPQHPDVPFALLYSARGEIIEDVSVSTEQSHTPKVWALEGSVRITANDPSIPSRLNSENDLNDFLPGFLELVKTDLPTVLHASDGSLPSSMIQAVQTTDLVMCESAVFLPIRPTGDTCLGFLIVGINPRKYYDEDYQLFIRLLNGQLTTSIAAAVLFEEETRRARIGAEIATQDRNLLSEKLEKKTHEASEIESRFRRMADMAPVGMFHVNPEGYIVYANEYWYALAQQERENLYPMSWYKSVIPEDHAIADREWTKVIGGEPVTFELRLNKPFEAKEAQEGQKIIGPTWVLTAAYPERAEDGTVIGVLGCVTDISRQKWAEGFQKRKMLEALELKRQQEKFIDITSHEMRNPLSAIIQCADMLSSSLVEFDLGLGNITIPREVIESHADAAQTIVLCAQHQKRIIDDILVLSKLESNLLLITPIEVQPVAVIEGALKMFDGEVQKADVELRFRVEQSFKDLAIDWVRLDPSRLLQVFINLITNAIKFTQPEPKRQIIITIGASLDHPAVRNGIEYLPREIARKDLSVGPEWGSGQVVYLYIEVQDSGRGLSDRERKLLFQRFSQASPRTHVQYGGSGLGLFISRELTELQGGQIGVASEIGVGSTFAFYVKTRRCSPPETSAPNGAHFIDMRVHADLPYNAGLAGTQSSINPPKVESQASVPALPPIHVLVVEDNLVNQKVLSKQLRNEGCIVSVANHGEEALLFLSTTRFWKGRESNGVPLSIVLMDLEMPIMDGLTCVKRIRELQKEGVVVAHVPVIAVTANARSEQIATAKNSGMDSVVTKPFRIPELMPEIDKQIRKGIE